MTWAFVFTATVIMDIVWAEWSKAVTAKRAELAGHYAAALIVCSAFVTIEFVHNHWLMIPAGAGAWIGTWWAVRRG